MAAHERDRSRSPLVRSEVERPPEQDIPVLTLHGLAPHITEQDIRTACLAVGVASKNVKLVRKEGGDTIGIAVAEFFSPEDTRRLMETQRGQLMIRGQFRAVLKFCSGVKWSCTCGTANAKTEAKCARCGSSDVCAQPTTIVVLSNLTPDVTEARLLELLNQSGNLAIKCLRRTSPTVCYIEMNNLTDAVLLHYALSDANLKLGYYRPKSIPSSNASARSAVAAAQWNNTLADVPRMAEYSANMYAKSFEEKRMYLKYYTDYYTKQVAVSGSGESASATPDGLGKKTYPTPDISSYQYDQTSGFYYDPSTKLYYDANTSYYYNSQSGKYLYWDRARCSYFNVANDQSVSKSSANDNQSNQSPEVVKKTEEKVKVAKRVAKDMEKWAKKLNQRKEMAMNESSVQSPEREELSNTPHLGAANVCFSVLGVVQEEKEKSSLVPAYASDEEPEENVAGEEKQQVDWERLACLLCKRQFASKDILLKHTQKSELHLTNLRLWYTSRDLDPSDETKRAAQYRDRAKERRLKFGESDAPPTNKLKSKYMKIKEAAVTYEEPTKKGIGADNVGNKLLQKMGWTEGQGLGKSNQGRTSIIEAEARVSSAGLGTNAIGMQPGPGESYKDCVKKMMRARYQQLD